MADTPAGRQARHLFTKAMYYVYAINSKVRNYLYVGITNNINKRISQSKTTKPYRPFKLIYQEGFSTRIEARKREKYLKSGCGREYLKQLL